MNPNRIKNLKPFYAADTRINREGRPKQIPGIDELLAAVMGEETKVGITAAEVILRALRKKAERGDVRAAEVLLERMLVK